MEPIHKNPKGNSAHNSEQKVQEKPSQLNQNGRPKQNVTLYSLTTEMVQQARSFIDQDLNTLPEKMYEEALNKSDKIWDKFYKHHKCNFFKDRNYLQRQIKEITYMRLKYEHDGTKSIFAELGCGVGNTLFPILREYEFFKCLGCDISENAINLIKNQIQEHKEYEDRLAVATCDLVKQQIPFEEKPDLISMIFVLSAIVPEQHERVLKKIIDWMKPGSFFYFRDYGRYDFGQINMSKKGNRKLSENFYMKNDGVCVYYFEQKELEALCQKLGLVKIEGDVHCRLLQNRKLDLKMYRVWVQARFYKPPLAQFYKHKIEEEIANRQQEKAKDSCKQKEQPVQQHEPQKQQNPHSNQSQQKSKQMPPYQEQ